MTREHLPPASAGNKGQYRSFSYSDWLRRDEGSLRLVGGTPGQGGMWGYTLCKACNDLTGHWYGAEYRGWAVRAAKMLAQIPATVAERDDDPVPYGVSFALGGNTDRGVAPGSFIRQVLSCMCSLSSGWDLAGRNPSIREIVIDGACATLTQVRVFLKFCWGPQSRLVGPQLVCDAETGEWAWVMEMSHAPLSLLLVLESNHDVQSGGVDITSFTEIEPKYRGTFEVDEPVEVGFTWSPYPWDFRSTAAILGTSEGPSTTSFG